MSAIPDAVTELTRIASVFEGIARIPEREQDRRAVRGLMGFGSQDPEEASARRRTLRVVQ